MATLSIRSVTKRFGAVDAIRGVSLEIADGEFVALVGPSGCGKSTLLRMVAGLEEISSGAILLDGARIDGMPPKSRDMAMVFQSYALYPHKTVAENMGFALKMRKRPAEEIRRKVGEAAEILGLTPLLGRYPKELSGGQRQRVAMGRAIMREPKLFLFDEPLSNLDAKLRVQMRSEIKELRQRLGVTTLYVTHDQIEAMTLADRVVVMNHGVVEQEGPPLDLFDAPRNRFVAGFIGSPPMNFFEGTVGGGAFRSRGGVALPLPPDAPWVEGAATYGVRPEHIRLAENGAAARVIVVEPTGTETLLKLSFGAEDAVAVLRERLSVRPGDTLRVAVEPGRGHLFPPEARAAE